LTLLSKLSFRNFSGIRGWPFSLTFPAWAAGQVYSRSAAVAYFSASLGFFLSVSTSRANAA
jgi:hypothetical protein